MARQGGQRHKVVSSGRLTGSGRGQLTKKNLVEPSAMRSAQYDDSLPVPTQPKTWRLDEADEDTTTHKPDVENHTDPEVECFVPGYPHLKTQVVGRHVAPLEPAYSLYSTDSEDQVTTLHKGLDRCAALLSDILQAEKTESKPKSHLLNVVPPKNKASLGKTEAERKRLGKKSSTVTRISKRPAPVQKTILSSQSGFKGQPGFHHESAVGAGTGSQVRPVVQVQHVQPHSFPVVCTMPGGSNSLPSTGLQTSTVFNCRLTTSTPALSPQRPTSAPSQATPRRSDGEMHQFTQQWAVAPSQHEALSATVSPAQYTASISVAPVSAVPVLQQASIPPEVKLGLCTSPLNSPPVGLVEQSAPLRSSPTVGAQISTREPVQVATQVPVPPSSREQQLSSEECLSSSEGSGGCTSEEEETDGMDTMPVRDTGCQTSKHKVTLDHKPKAASPEKTARKVMTVKCLLGELKALVANQDTEAVRLISEVEQSVDLLPTMVGSTNVQAELALALQPLRSENVQLRRRLRILNQQLQERERAERQARPVDCTLELASLQSLNLMLQTRLNDRHRELGNLQQDNRRLQQALEDKEKDLQQTKERCEMETGRIRVDVSEALAEMRNCQAKLEACEREKTALARSLEQKEAEVTRLQEIMRNFQKSPAARHLAQTDEPRPAQLTKSALDQYENRREATLTDRVSDSVKAYLQSLEDTGNRCLPSPPPTSTGQWTVGQQSSGSQETGSTDGGQTAFVPLKETVKVQSAQELAPAQNNGPANGHVGLKYLGLAFEKLGIPAEGVEALDDERGRDFLTHPDGVGSQLKRTNDRSEQSQRARRCLRMPEVYAGRASEFENTFSSCDIKSLASDWSVNSRSTFNTRDEQDFRNGLAALDASIASLQKTLRADLKK